jgi:hypothetical protein
MTAIAFCDLPDDQRMALRAAMMAAGGHIAEYYGPAVSVAIPNPSGPFYTAMDEAGLVLDERSLQYFPLGTDSPPDSLRHDGRFPGSAGFWLYGNFTPQPAGGDDER